MSTDAAGRLTLLDLIHAPRSARGIVVEVLAEDYADLLRDRAGREVLGRALEAVEWIDFDVCPWCDGGKDDESLTGGHQFDCRLYLALIRSGWRVRKCAVCGCRDVPPEAETPLCGTCEGASREAGRQSAEAARYTREAGR